MTESAGSVTSHEEDKIKRHTSGIAIRGIDLKIDNPDKDGHGEVCMRGRNIFMGYYKNSKATLDCFDKDGFLHSGDIGMLEDGHLEITGRIKELIITAGGENIAPLVIEMEFKSICPFCSNIVVIGDKRNFLSALITLKVEEDLKKLEPSHNLSNEFKT